MEQKSSLDTINKYRSAVMGFAALWILFFHMWQPLFSKDASGALFYVENVVKRLGFEGVDIFFLLSGMGMTYAIGKHSLGGFYFRRFKRIALPFVFIAAFRAIVEHWGFGGFVSVVTGFNFFTGNMYFCLWFVTAIALIYLVFPLYWRVFAQSRSKLIFTAAAIAIWYALSLLLIGVMKEDMYGFTNRIPVFLTGVYLGWRAQNATKHPSRSTVLLLAFVSTAAGLVLSFLCNFRSLEFILPESNCCLPDYLTALGLVVLLSEFFAWLESLCSVTRALNCALKFIGGISLEFYCVQEFLGGKTGNVLSGKVPDIVVNIAVLAVVTVTAWVLHRLNNMLWSYLARAKENSQEKA